MEEEKSYALYEESLLRGCCDLEKQNNKPTTNTTIQLDKMDVLPFKQAELNPKTNCKASDDDELFELHDFNLKECPVEENVPPKLQSLSDKEEKRRRNNN